MSMFSNMAPIYFVFHHPGEKYYRESMLCLGFERYITIELHKSGYQNVIFLNAIAGAESYTFQIFDRDSYSKNDYPGLLKGFPKRLWEDWNPEQRSITVQAKNDAVAKWLLCRMRENKTAVVTDAATLKTLLRKNEEQYKKLSELVLRHNSSGSILITAPMQLVENDLLDIVDLFQKWPELFPEFSGLIANGAENVFEALRLQMPDRIIELGDISANELRTILRNVEFECGTEMDHTDFEDYVSYLYYWLHSNALRRKEGLFKSWEAPFLRNRLYSNLVQETQLTQLKNTIEWKKKTAKQLPVALAKEYSIDRETVSIRHGVLQKIAQMPCPSAANSAQIHHPDEKVWHELQENLLKPQTKWPKQQWLSCMQKTYTIWEWADKNKDYDTKCRAVNVMQCCAQKLYSDEDAAYGRTALTYLETSRNFRLQMTSVSSYGSVTSKQEAAYQLLDAENLKHMVDILEKGDAYYIPKLQMKHEDLTAFWAEWDNVNTETSNMDGEEVFGDFEEKKSVDQIRMENPLDEYT